MDYTKTVFIMMHILSVFLYLYAINKSPNGDRKRMLEEVDEIKLQLDEKREKHHRSQEEFDGLKLDYTQIKKETEIILEERQALLEQKEELEQIAREVLSYELTEEEALKKYKQKEQEKEEQLSTEGGN